MLKASRQEDFSSVFAKYDGFFFKLSLTHFLADSGPMIQVGTLVVAPDADLSLLRVTK